MWSGYIGWMKWMVVTQNHARGEEVDPCPGQWGWETGKPDSDLSLLRNFVTRIWIAESEVKLRVCSFGLSGALPPLVQPCL
jgi:hypothetical protein